MDCVCKITVFSIDFEFFELLKEYYLSKVVCLPARIFGNDTQRVLDLFFTNYPDNVLLLDIVDPFSMQFPTDHFTIFFNFKV